MEKKRYFHPLGIKNYEVKDSFWSPKMEMVRTKMIPYQWKALNDQVTDAAPSHCIQNFKIAAGMEEGKFEGCVFQDSDVAKWLEAVAYTLAWKKDEKLEALADSVIEIIRKAQQPDGYLDTYYIINGLDKRWTNLADNHELYCAGHMIEAGVAYYQETGKTVLLEVVKKLADCVDRTFGREEGKLHGYPGHEVIEMALVRLYHVTGEERYLRLAEYFISQRGQEPLYFREEKEKYHNPFYWERSLFQYQYYQAGKPVREQKHAEGHAVRAAYLYSGMTDVARETGDESLMEAVKTLWEDVTKRQMYITGAIGSSEYGEAFTFPYDLPNDEVYGETCAAIGLVFWAGRMLETELDGNYGDVMERTLYNGCISGMSTDGTRFFYANPLEVNPEACRKDQRKKHIDVERQKWFSCACCPPNLARLTASLGNYVCGIREDTLAFHLYIGGVAAVPEKEMSVAVESGLPWKGEATLTMQGNPGQMTVALRIPGWCRNWTVLVNGETAEGVLEKGYLYLERNWKAGDKISLNLEMQAERNYANPGVKADIGKVAITRGPLVYCLEEVDNGAGLTRMFLPEKSSFTLAESGLEEGAVTLLTDGCQLATEGWEHSLYRFEKPDTFEKKQLTFLPYYLWNNRGVGEMTVWVNEIQQAP